MAETKETKTVEVVNKNATKRFNSNNKTNGKKPQRRNGNKGRKFNNRNRVQFEEKVVNIARVTKTVKGGRTFSFAALAVIGDKKGKVGYGSGKSKEVPSAINKAIRAARQNIISVPVVDGRTVPHVATGKFLASRVMVKPAPKGKGIIASGSVRSVVELAGYKDIYTKSLGSRSKINSVKATFEALRQLRTVNEIAKLRDISVEQLTN